MIDFVSELRDEIARLTAERDELLREAESRLKIITLMGVERREMWVAKERAEADLAAARAALLDIQRTVHKHVADRIAEETLARLGTGEALAAVREAQGALKVAKDAIVGEWGNDISSYPSSGMSLEPVLARLRAAFGEPR